MLICLHKIFMSKKNNKINHKKSITHKYNIIVNCNLKLQVIAKDYHDAIIEAEDYELPKEYVEDSFEIVKVLDENGNKIIK